MRPQCGWPNAKALNAASGATEVLNRLQLFERVEDAAADLHRLYATTARTARSRQARGQPARRGAARRAPRSRAGERVGILFGPERTGLANDELVLADARAAACPVNPAFFSLNLAQAVLLVAYEWFQSAGDAPGRREVDARRAAGDQGRARPAARAPDRRARRGQLLPHAPTAARAWRARCG